MQDTITSPTRHPAYPASPCVRAGVGLQQSLDTQSTGILILEGVLDSIAAGALLFVALAGPMNAVRVNSKWLSQQGDLVRLCCFACMCVGAGVMSFIGKWA